jgi:hypothetical protein
VDRRVIIEPSRSTSESSDSRRMRRFHWFTQRVELCHCGAGFWFRVPGVSGCRVRRSPASSASRQPVQRLPWSRAEASNQTLDPIDGQLTPDNRRCRDPSTEHAICGAHIAVRGGGRAALEAGGGPTLCVGSLRDCLRSTGSVTAQPARTFGGREDSRETLWFRSHSTAVAHAVRVVGEDGPPSAPLVIGEASVHG